MALLTKYAAAGAFTDCYAADVARPVSLAEFVETFYTGRLFKMERLLLRLLVSLPSTDAEARELASGARTAFAAWRVEERTADQLLMCDLRGRTRSWLMVAPVAATGRTTLHFGSAVLPVVSRSSGEARMSGSFHALLGFHAWYSRALLESARARLARLGS